MSRFEGAAELGVQVASRAREVIGRDSQWLGDHPVEPQRELTEGIVTPVAHVGDDGPHGGDRRLTGEFGPGQACLQISRDPSQVEAVQHVRRRGLGGLMGPSPYRRPRRPADPVSAPSD